MKQIMFYLLVIIVFLTSSVNCTNTKIRAIVEGVDDLLPAAVSSFLSSQKDGLTNSLKDGLEAAKKLVTDKVIPISQLPLYTYRAENKIYNVAALKRHGEEFVGASIQPGTHLQNLAEFYGFFDMIDVKHVLCEFFYTSAEIVFYRGKDNFDAKILKDVEKLGVLKPEDIKTLEELGFDKKGQALRMWYWSEKYRQFIPMMGEPIGQITEGKGYKILSKEKVAIKKKYYKLTDDIATLVWHLFFTYQEEHAPRENIVHKHLKMEQIRGHLMGNSFVFSILHDTMKFLKLRNMYLGADPLDTASLKKEIKSFIKKLGKIYTDGEVDPFEEKTLIQKIVHYVLSKLRLIKNDSDLVVMYKFKLEVLVILSKILQRAYLDEEKAKKIIELCINNWKIVFYLHVCGTMTSTKPAPKFYHHHETEEETNSVETSDSDTLENDKSSNLGSFKIIDDNDTNSSRNRIITNNDDSVDTDDISEFGDRTLEEKDLIAKLMEDKNPFKDLLRRALLIVDLDMKRIRAQLISNFQIICTNLLLNKEECAFIKRSIRNINTYKLEKDGRIASRKYCNQHQKMTEIQGVCMGIIEYLILQCEENQSLENLTKNQKSKLRRDIKTMFRENFFLRIFVTKEYRRALTNYAEGKKDSNIAKLAEVRVQQIKKGVGLMPNKPPEMDPHDMDSVLMADNS